MRIWLKENTPRIKLVFIVLVLMADFFFIGSILAIAHGYTDWHSSVKYKLPTS